MYKLLEFLQKRPKDSTIRIMKVVFGLLFTWITAYNIVYLDKEIVTTIFWYDLAVYEEYIRYSICSLWVFPIITWVFDLHLFKSKYTRLLHIFYSILLFYVWWSLIKETPYIDVDFAISLMWIPPLLSWMTWKFTTKKWLRHGEKVTKIRV